MSFSLRAVAISALILGATTGIAAAESAAPSGAPAGPALRGTAPAAAATQAEGDELVGVVVAEVATPMPATPGGAEAAASAVIGEVVAEASAESPPSVTEEPASQEAEQPLQGSVDPTFKDRERGPEATSGGCLCIFDIDRTLTGKQGVAGSECPGNSVKHGVYDDAYGGGELTLSQLGVAGVHSTACGGCYIGIVSLGNAGGGTMKEVIRSTLGSVSGDWSYGKGVHSPLVLGCSDKPACAEGVMNYYNSQGAGLSKADVYMFDDKGSNIASFYGSGMNALQISCGSRDGDVGLCGGTTSQITLSRGVTMCR